MRSVPILILTGCLVGFVAEPAAAAGGGGGGGGGNIFSQPERRSMTPEQKAEMRYRKGLKKRDYAWKHERKAAEASSEKKRQKELGKAEKDWHSAIKYFNQALELHPNYHEAHSSLGYALRQIGEWEAAVAAYDQALGLAPGYAEAIEYRAEAYLALGRLGDVSEAYMSLLRIDQERADELMTAIDNWIQAAEREPPDVAPETLEWFRGWVSERKELAQQQELPLTSERSW